MTPLPPRESAPPSHPCRYCGEPVFASGSEIPATCPKCRGPHAPWRPRAPLDPDGGKDDV